MTPIEALNEAALRIAVAVDIDARMKANPAEPGDRSPRAEKDRAQQMRQYLTAYREAKDAFEADHRGGL